MSTVRPECIHCLHIYPLWELYRREADTSQKQEQMKVQTLGELRMRGTTNLWTGLMVFTRGLPLVARGESDTGKLQ